MCEECRSENTSLSTVPVVRSRPEDFLALLSTGASGIKSAEDVTKTEDQPSKNPKAKVGVKTSVLHVDCGVSNYIIGTPVATEGCAGTAFDSHVKLSDHVLFPDINPKTTNSSFPNGDGHSIVKNRTIQKRIEEHDMFFSGLKRYDEKKNTGKSPVAKSIDKCIREYEVSKKPKPPKKKEECIPDFRRLHCR